MALKSPLLRHCKRAGLTSSLSSWPGQIPYLHLISGPYRGRVGGGQGTSSSCLRLTPIRSEGVQRDPALHPATPYFLAAFPGLIFSYRDVLTGWPRSLRHQSWSLGSGQFTRGASFSSGPTTGCMPFFTTHPSDETSQLWLACRTRYSNIPSPIFPLTRGL